jgi:protein ImuB
MKRVISLWLPTFETDRLSRRKGNKKSAKNLGPLLVTITALHGGQRIAAVNAAADIQGIKPGLSLADARAQFPDITVKQADPTADLRALNKLAQACERYSPWTAIEPLGNNMLTSMSGGGSIWIDITGCEHLYKGERPLIEDLRDRCTRAGYHPRIGLADTPGAAWAAARFSKTPYCIIPPKAQRKSLSAYPITALRLNPKALEGLENLGLRHIYDLYEIPRAPLFSRFGDQVLRRLDQMLGRIEEPISSRRSVPQYYVRMLFAEPIGRIEDVRLALHKLLTKLCLTLETKNLGVRRLELIIFRVDKSRRQLEIGTSQASRDPDHLARLFCDNLDTVNPGFGIEIIVLAATETNVFNACQIDIGGKTVHQVNESAAKLVDRLSGRLGMHNVIRMYPIESHLPERSTKMFPALKTSLFNNNWKGTIHLPKRPVQLLQHPFPIDVIAPIPDGPPVIFIWQKQQHKIIYAQGPERISPEWWRPPQLQTCSHSLTRKTRDYYHLEDQNGQRYWVYRDGIYHSNNSPRWYLHGFFA